MSATAALRRTESSAPEASTVAICRIFAASSAAPRTSCACSAARLERSWHVADISSVDALISSVDAEISRSEEHTSELQSRLHLVCRLLLEKKKKQLENIDTR